MSAVLTYQLPPCLWVRRKHGKKNKRADGNLLSADYPDATLLRTSAPAFNPLHRVAVRVDDRSALFCWFGEISVINTYRTKSSLRKPILKTKSNLAHTWCSVESHLSERCSPGTLVPHSVRIGVAPPIPAHQDQLRTNNKWRPVYNDERQKILLSTHLATSNQVLPQW